MGHKPNFPSLARSGAPASRVGVRLCFVAMVFASVAFAFGLFQMATRFPQGADHASIRGWTVQAVKSDAPAPCCRSADADRPAPDPGIQATAADAGHTR